MKFVANRNVTLRSKSGHIIRFERGVPKEVPPAVRREAMAIGVVPVEGSLDVEAQDTAAINGQPNSLAFTIPQDLRDSLIFAAMDELRSENDNARFDAAGRPKVDAVNARFFGLMSINSNERNKYWDELRARSSNGEETPQHQHLKAFLDIAGATSRDELREFAEVLGVDVESVEAVSVRDARRLLVKALLAS